MTTPPLEFPSLTVGPVTFSASRPAIVTPIVATTIEDSLLQVQNVLDSDNSEDVDVLEWRIDYLFDRTPLDELSHAIEALTRRLKDKRLLVTLRTSKEGGEAHISDDDYLTAVSGLSSALQGHLIDIEYSRDTAKQAIYAAQANQAVVIGSYHDFTKTPPSVQISAHLRAIIFAGADIAKIAVTPNSPEDTLESMQASLQAAQKLQRPCIVISMGKYGMVTRIAGGTFGSCATFASAGEVSAPGQLPIDLIAGVRAAMS